MIIEINQYLVPLTRDKFAVVCQEGWEKVKHYKWHYATRGYAERRDSKEPGQLKTKLIKMHRFLINCPDCMDVDHINGDTLDNRLCNLRVCTRGQNNMNRAKKPNCSSKYKGVSFHKQRQKWTAKIEYNYKPEYIGLFEFEEDAARAYNKKATEYFGEFARLNEV